MKLPKSYIPLSYKGKVHWYIAPWTTSSPIHLFRSIKQATNWANNQPDEIIENVVMTPSFNWFPANSCPKHHISSTREFIDHRNEEKLYRCEFVGKLTGASGIMYPFTVNIRCTPDRILNTLYKQYDHIRSLTVFSEDDQLRVLYSTYTDNIDGVIQTWEDS
jgi:hypothetical protein